MLPVEAPRFPLAACRAPGVDAAWFFPGRGDKRSLRAAQAVCAGCAEREECLEYALADWTLLGVWGGLSELGRRAERRRRRLHVVTDLTLDPPAANGHAPDPAPEESGERTCKQCGASLAGLDPRRVYCSDRCKHRSEAQRRPRTARRASKRSGGQSSSPGPLPQGGDRLGEVVAALVGAGLAVSVDVDGVTLNVRAG